jgi:N utilization substance protein B
MKTSKDPRHLARRVALQTLFHWSSRDDLAANDTSLKEQTFQSVLENLTEDLHEAKPNLAMAHELIDGVVDQKAQLDGIIGQCAPEWPVDQIAKVDANILRIAIFELLHRSDTPLKVAIDEAVELAKEFGSDASSKFVNGVLGTVVKEHLPESTAQTETVVS